MNAQRLAIGCVIVGTVAIGIGSLTIRFRHPELTETQLLLTYWPYWLVVVGWSGLALFVLSLTARNR